MTGVLIRRGEDTQTHRREKGRHWRDEGRHWREEGRHWRDAAPGKGHQGCPAIPEAGRGKERFFARAGAWPYQHLDIRLERLHGSVNPLTSDFWPPERWENTFLLF